MSQSMNPARYPPHIKALVARLPDGPFTMDFATKAEAKAIQFALYGYRMSLLTRIGEPSMAYSTKNEAEFDELYPGLRFCTTAIKEIEGKWVLAISPYFGPVDALDVLEELSTKHNIQPIAGAVPVSIERKDDGELER